MIETTVANYLRSQLNNIEVYMELPDELPSGNFLIIDRTAHTKSAAGNQTSTLAIQSYSSSNYSAAQLNERVCEVMMQAAERLTNVFRADLNGDYPFPDLANKRYRYQAVFNLAYFE